MASVYPETKSFLFTFFSKLTGREVIDSSGNIVGKVYDVVVVTSEVYPKAVELVINRGFFKRRYAYVPWTALVEFNGQVRLSIKDAALKFSPLKEARAEISLRRDILDQQVVDTFNRRVVRVNDLHLLKVGLDLMVAHIDIGVKGLLRRLGFDRIADFVMKLVAWNSSYLKKENFISTKYVQILSVNPASSNLKVSVPYRQFSQIHPVELSEIIADLDPDQKLALFRALETETQAKVFVDLDNETQKFLIHGIDLDEIAKLVAILPSDEAADFLDLIPKKMVEQLLARIETVRAKKLSTLLGYASDSAGGLMTTEYIAVPATLPVKEVLERVRESNLRSEMIYYVYIVDENNRLVGSTNLKGLLAALPDDNVLATANPKTAAVHLNDDVKEVAFLIEKYGLFALPVIDNDRVLQGIITVDDILEQLLALVWRRRTRL